MIEWISVKEFLPKHGDRVLIWNGGVDVATFKKGISSEEREKMKAGELEDYEEEGWCGTLGYFKIKRSEAIKAYDEWGNNAVPYGWDVGGTVLFGQNISHWAHYNTPEQYKEYRIKELQQEIELQRRTMQFDEMLSSIESVKKWDGRSK